MARERAVVCEFYQYENGNCEKRVNMKTRFWGDCQTCAKYQPKAGAKPARTDNRRQRLERAERKDRYE